MPSAAEDAEFLRRKSAKIWQCWLKRRDWIVFSSELLNSNVEAVALTKAHENVGANHDISFEAPYTHSLAGHIDVLFSGVFVCNL